MSIWPRRSPNQLGLKLEVVTLGSAGSEVDVDSALRKGDVDIVMGATSSDESGNVWVSKPYTQTGVALFAAPESKVPSRDASPKIAAQSSSTSAWAVTNAFGDDALVAKADLLPRFLPSRRAIPNMSRPMRSLERMPPWARTSTSSLCACSAASADTEWLQTPITPTFRRPSPAPSRR